MQPLFTVYKNKLVTFKKFSDSKSSINFYFFSHKDKTTSKEWYNRQYRLTDPLHNGQHTYLCFSVCHLGGEGVGGGSTLCMKELTPKIMDMVDILRRSVLCCARGLDTISVVLQEVHFKNKYILKSTKSCKLPPETKYLNHINALNQA